MSLPHEGNAAGRWTRRAASSTDTVPKALVEAGGKPLIVWHLERLARAGIRDAVINISHLGERIVERLGDGARFGLRLHTPANASASRPPAALPMRSSFWGGHRFSW
jgi:N-acetyl-alpha-D-muramate 1-phosphate uridylyltransferase